MECMKIEGCTLLGHKRNSDIFLN